MRFGSWDGVLLAVVCLSTSLAAQTIYPSPAAGDIHFSIVTAPAVTGDQISVYSPAKNGRCNAQATPVSVAPYTNTLVLAGGITAITLAEPLKQSQLLCILTTHTQDRSTHSSAVVSVGAAQGPNTAPLIDPAKGTPLPASSNVSSSVAVTAVLIPFGSAKRIFGKQIAEHYAVVQLTISNHSPDAALILQSASLDYSHWLFSNIFHGPTSPDLDVATDTNEAANKAPQIGSAESRLVRGELQDSQSTSLRNLFISSLTAVGSIASGFQFLTVDPLYLSGISAFGNQVVPALGILWPDHTQLELNRISDFGFSTNHVVAKQTSDIVVAFFPISDFLTPSLRRQFLKSPAVFAVPFEMMLDSKSRDSLVGMLKVAGALKSGDNADAVSTALSHYQQYMAFHSQLPSGVCSDGNTIAAGALTCPELTLINLLQSASINNIRLVIGGVMTVDVSLVPASITGISFIDAAKPATWKSGSKVSGTVAGSFLTGAQIKLATPVAGIGDITVDPKTSTDKQLAFSFTLTADIPEKTKLTLLLTKVGSDKSTSTSSPFDYLVSFDDTLTLDKDTVASTWTVSGTPPVATVTGTVIGSGLAGATVVLNNPPATIGQPKVDPGSSDTSLSFNISLKNTIQSGTKLSFTVIKKNPDGSTTPGQTIPYSVSYK